mgnify:CR=1 FL=1
MSDAVKKVLLAAPRGYCAGVDRAVETVEKALEKYGAPVYVRKEIVHNKHIVRTLERRGAVFVEETDEVEAAGEAGDEQEKEAPEAEVDDDESDDDTAAKGVRRRRKPEAKPEAPAAAEVTGLWARKLGQFQLIRFVVQEQPTADAFVQTFMEWEGRRPVGVS